MEPAHPSLEDFLPVEIACLQLRRSFIATVIKNHRRAYSLAAITIYRGHIWPVDTIVFEPLIKRFDPHRPDPLGNQFADRIIDHCRDNARLKAKTISQVGRNVELASAHVDLAL